ncbi:MAG TPA: prepilin peptidase [Actinomycetota bacterium]|nr:prepilin peptidase [Actinomycetota bacterium]
MTLGVILAFVLGLIFGSFGTVAAHRIPRRETIVTGRSKCPNCGRKIRAHENVPVVSYLILRGRCPGCGTKISLGYPLIELVTGVLFALAVVKFEVTVTAVVYAAFFWVLVVLTVIDLEHKLLPNRIVYPTFVVGWAGLVIAALVDGDTERLRSAALGAVVFGGFFFVVAFVYPAGMGGGDVKLAFVLGTFVGYAGGVGAVLAGMFASFLLGGVIGIIAMRFSGKGRKTQIPFGPFLALGSVIAVFLGERIAEGYVEFL